MIGPVRLGGGTEGNGAFMARRSPSISTRSVIPNRYGLCHTQPLLPDPCLRNVRGSAFVRQSNTRFCGQPGQTQNVSKRPRKCHRRRSFPLAIRLTTSPQRHEDFTDPWRRGLPELPRLADPTLGNARSVRTSAFLPLERHSSLGSLASEDTADPSDPSR